MAYLVIVINSSNDDVNNLNSKIQDAGKPNSVLANLENYISALEGGAVNGTIQVTTRDTDPAVATHGTGSQQNTYSKA